MNTLNKTPKQLPPIDLGSLNFANLTPSKTIDCSKQPVVELKCSVQADEVQIRFQLFGVRTSFLILSFKNSFFCQIPKINGRQKMVRKRRFLYQSNKPYKAVFDYSSHRRYYALFEGRN